MEGKGAFGARGNGEGGCMGGWERNGKARQGWKGGRGKRERGRGREEIQEKRAGGREERMDIEIKRRGIGEEEEGGSGLEVEWPNWRGKAV